MCYQPVPSSCTPISIYRAWVAAAVINPELDLGDPSQAIFVASFHHSRSMDDDASPELELHNSLTASLHALDLLQERACKAGIVKGDNCKPFVKPNWQDDPTKDRREIETRISDTLGLVLPLVDEICGLGAIKSGDNLICSVE